MWTGSCNKGRTGKMLTEITLLVLAWTGVYGKIERPRGVAISQASIYDPSSGTFQCMDGSAKIPYEHVNDDYCDCEDGSDEPGTSACPNGLFHCTNAGYKPTYVLSSRVNDGVCDCCDGTDEYSGNIDCVNNCKEMGRQMREEQTRTQQLQEEGYKKKQQFAADGRILREQKKTRLEELEAERTEVEINRNDLETLKNEAETPEKEAKDLHEKNWEEIKAQKDAEKDKARALVAFEELDTDNDKMVDILEMVVHKEFDIDSNGLVSDEEAKEHLEDVEKADLDHFLEKVWPNIKSIYKPLAGEVETKGDNQDNPDTTTPSPPGEQQVTPPSTRGQIPSPPLESLDEDEEEEEEEDDDYGDEEEEVDRHLDDDHDSEVREPPKPDEDHDKKPDYDEETRKYVEAADEARRQFNEADQKLKDLDREIRDLQDYVNLDLGAEEEFGGLKDNCYEYTDREYTYKLCPFSRASQRPKSGGTETTLGNWGFWDGTPDDKYSAQKYEKGQNCWNGPDRSVKVYLKCGLENELTSTYEPSRCEYAFDFNTPSRCSHQQEEKPDVHDEL